MADSNRSQVGRALELLAEGLRPFVEAKLTAALGPRWRDAFEQASSAGPPRSLDDPATLIGLVLDHWSDVFAAELGRSARSWVHEIRDWRNKWAHNDGFSADDAYRALDSIERVLAAADAREADEVGRMKGEVIRRREEREVRKVMAQASSEHASGLPAWREVIVPHRDVIEGRLAQAEFAANLAEVAAGRGSLEYRDPVEFFHRTYLTEGLRLLARLAIERLADRGGEAVVNLQTTFGGGKTHSLIALWHLASGRPLGELSEELAALARDVGGTMPATIRRAAIVGIDLAPGQPTTKPDGTTIHTLWGELAWQLLGRKGYELVAEADRSATNPGAALRELVARAAPCVILIDEWIAYARQLVEPRTPLPAGTIDAQTAFAQALTEAVRAVPGALLVVSLPVSEQGAPGEVRDAGIELGGPRGEEALARLGAVLGRMETAWRPASIEESFEIVRRRLFEPVPAEREAQREAVVRSFARLYEDPASGVPSHVREGAYAERLRRAYPIHPELFDTLYQAWSTLERFQRTRGVLRLMALVVATLWHREDRSPLILPGNVPLDEITVRTELLRYLEDSWDTILDDEVDSSDQRALAVRLDAEDASRLGALRAARKVARTIFLATAPLVTAQHHGVDAARVRLGVLAPGEQPGAYRDALTRLAERATYLYSDGDRYWFALQPSIRRRAQELRARYREDAERLEHAIVEGLRGEVGRGVFEGVHVAPVRPGDVPDEPRLRLVVLGPGQQPAEEAARGFEELALRILLERDEGVPRRFRTMLLFLAPQLQGLGGLRDAAAGVLAWRQLRDDLADGRIELSSQQQRILRQELDSAERAFSEQLRETYSRALVPEEHIERLGTYELHQRKVGRRSGMLAERVASALQDDGEILARLAPTILRQRLDHELAPLWRDGHVGVRELWEVFASYPYLDRLVNQSVLEHAIIDAVALTTWPEDGVAVADAFDEASGRYRGLRAGERLSGLAPGMLVVKPSVAAAQLAAEAHGQPEVLEGPQPADEPRSREDLPGVALDAPRRVRARYFGSVALDTDRPIPALTAIVSDLVQHLRDAGGQVELVLEVHATGIDLDARLRRVVEENARVLHFRESGFDEDAPPTV